MSDLTARLMKTARRRLGLSLAELATQTGRDVLTCRRWEQRADSSGHRSPPSELLAELLRRAGMLQGEAPGAPPGDTAAKEARDHG